MKLEVPHKYQLNNFLQSKRRKQSPPVVSMGSLEDFVDNYSDRPTQVDCSYVIKSEFDYEGKWFGISVSTQRLLQLLDKHDGVQCDATYKLTWEGFPILITGLSDKDNVFHPVSMSLTFGETARDYRFIFKALLEGKDMTERR